MSAATGYERVARSNDDLKLGLRLAAVGFVAALLQVSFFGGLRIVGADLDILPLVALTAGFLAGPAGGAAVGFGMGILIDLFLAVPLGLTSLTLLVIGDIGGRVGSARDPEGLMVPMITGTIVTFGALVFEGVVQVMLSSPAAVSWELLQMVVSASLLNGLLAPLVYRSTRRGLVGALPRDPRARRRMATTTRLSPLSSSTGGQVRSRSSAVSRSARSSGPLSGGQAQRRRGRSRRRR